LEFLVRTDSISQNHETLTIAPLFSWRDKWDRRDHGERVCKIHSQAAGLFSRSQPGAGHEAHRRIPRTQPGEPSRLHSVRYLASPECRQNMRRYQVARRQGQPSLSERRHDDNWRTKWYVSIPHKIEILSIADLADKALVQKLQRA